MGNPWNFVPICTRRRIHDPVAEPASTLRKRARAGREIPEADSFEAVLDGSFSISSGPAAGNLKYFSAVRRLLIVLSLVQALVVPASSSFAQTPTMGTLRVTVVDITGAVIVGAAVSVTNEDVSNLPGSIRPRW
jgi:hypothetical protein